MKLTWFKKRWVPTLLALGSLVVVAAVACGSDETSAPTSAAPQATQAPATAAPAPTSAPAPTAAPGGAAPTATAAPRATATTSPSGPSGGPSGSLTYAFSRLEAVYGIGYVGPYRTSATNQIGGIEENLFYFKDGNAMTPQLLESFESDSAGTRVRMTLRKDIPFQAPRGFENIDFGVLDAAELVEWFNRSNATTNPDSTYGDAGDYAAIFLEAKVIDDYTIEVGLVSPVFFCLPVSQFGCLSAARGPHKVTTADTQGVEWARAHHVGTGPYVQGNCTPGDRCTMHAVDSHWRQVGNVAEITGIQVPEAQTQIAMMRNGSIDMATIDYKLLPDVVDGTNFRFLETMPGGFVTQAVLFPGNLWEEFHARTGEPLNPWDSPVYDVDRPWLGDPWQETHADKGRYTDDNNPSGMTDMEQGRLVRLALSTAIDRDGINDVLLNGIGLPIYSEYMGPEYPGWDPSRMTGCFDINGNNITCSGSVQSVPWKIDDADLDEADRLLTLAGFPEATRGDDFGKLTLQAYAAEAGPVGLEVADAIMSDWARLGIEIEGLVEDYGGVISPRMRQRVQFLPVLKNGDVHSNVYPLDWPLPTVDTSSSRPGWGVGFESPAGAKWLFEILAEKDAKVREQKHLNWVDYSMFWIQYAGVFEVPKGIVVNNRVKSWNGYQQHYSNVSGNPEFIVLN
jgi:ABC-type transport system substrate-binding protein